MAIAPLGTTALQGIQRGMQGLRRAAVQVAQQGSRPAAGSDFARSMVEMKQHAVQAKASTRALKAYNDSMGTLLDIKA
jgi:hypothetical protein